MRSRCPSSIPGGSSTSYLRIPALRPAPSHSSQGVSAIRPSPPQASQVAARTSWPKAVRETKRTWPLPWHFSQVLIGVPGSAPLPLQCSQRITASKLSSLLAPLATSSSVTSTVVTTSPPAAGPRENPNGSPLPKKASKMSSIEPNPVLLGDQPPEPK